MEKVDLNAGGVSHGIFIGSKILDKLNDVVGDRKIYAVTDKNVAGYHLGALAAALGKNFDRIILPASENTKSLKYVGRIATDMIKKGHTRNSVVVAFGGGVVGDLSGFAASVFFRGVDFVQVPTTLLAAVDSSVGGKNGVNLPEMKNCIGIFKQPLAVLTDVDFLHTLPERELICGAGEIIKTALLDGEIYDFVLKNMPKILSLEAAATREIIKKCVILKSGVVAKDERESGLRKTLNAGHTVGHALETAGKYRLGHGEYILNGIFHECDIADGLGLIKKPYKQELQRLIASLINVMPLKDKDGLIKIMARDKKNDEDNISFILPVDRGVVKEIKFKKSDKIF
jgi:3-dehydroquinate synthase